MAMILTVPAYIGITSCRSLTEWFSSGAGWQAIAPLLRLLGSAGGEQNSDILFAGLLVISFALSLAVVLLIGVIISRRKRQSA
ncbi:hypothetical protein [Ralstonia solanacearum]|uniref:hypothetical protein n=1 Tax=Ralstonia pseudosolanacearum TaxID=1310165 RepID=UPI0012FD4B8B